MKIIIDIRAKKWREVDFLHALGSYEYGHVYE